MLFVRICECRILLGHQARQMIAQQQHSIPVDLKIPDFTAKASRFIVSKAIVVFASQGHEAPSLVVC